MLVIFSILHDVFTLTGELIPEGDRNLRLAETRTNELKFAEKSDIGNSKNSDLMEYDSVTKSIKVNGKTICSTYAKRELGFCSDKYLFAKWEREAEAGKYKFRTDDNMCLTVGKKTDTFSPAIIIKCNKNDLFQRFQYEKNESDGSPIEAIKNDYEEGGTVILNMALKAYDDDTNVEVIIHDSKDGNKRINTTVGEMNTLYAFNHNTEPINHDMLVDSTKNHHGREDNKTY
jgi:hypothetical protein